MINRHLHQKYAHRKIHTRSASAQSGFTLIELLVVVAIIGFLSSAITFSVSKAKDKAFDARRIEDMHRLEVDGQLAILEKRSIPIADNLDTKYFADAQNLTNPQEDNNTNTRQVESVGNRVVKYIGILPEDAYADSETLPISLSTNYQYLAPGQPKAFFRPGTVLPEDPACVSSNPATCYRAWYNGTSLVISTTLRTRYHTSGKNVQYGIVLGTVDSDALNASCLNLNFPIFDTNATASVGGSNPTCAGQSNGPASIIKGVSSGRDFDSSGGYGN